MKPYSVISVSEDNGQINLDWVKARNPLHAFMVAAKKRDPAEFVACLLGHISDGYDEGYLFFPGTASVYTCDILSQKGVFK